MYQTRTRQTPVTPHPPRLHGVEIQEGRRRGSNRDVRQKQQPQLGQDQHALHPFPVSVGADIVSADARHHLCKHAHRRQHTRHGGVIDTGTRHGQRIERGWHDGKGMIERDGDGVSVTLRHPSRKYVPTLWASFGRLRISATLVFSPSCPPAPPASVSLLPCKYFLVGLNKNVIPTPSLVCAGTFDRFSFPGMLSWLYRTRIRTCPYMPSIKT